MAVKIRLTRRGRKKLARFDLVIADARSPRDGRFIEKIGTYNPMTNPATIVLDDEKALDWLIKGAQPTDTARRILSYRGLLMKKHLQIGVLKGAISQEEADNRFEEWKKTKEEKIAGKVDSLAKQKADAEKARLEAERKVKEAKAEAVRKKQVVEEPVAEVSEETAGAVDREVEETVTETAEATVEETEAPETPKAEQTSEEVEVQAAENAKEVIAEEPKVEEAKAEATQATNTEDAKETKDEVVETPKAEETKVEEAETAKEEKTDDSSSEESESEEEKK